MHYLMRMTAALLVGRFRSYELRIDNYQRKRKKSFENCRQPPISYKVFIFMARKNNLIKLYYILLLIGYRKKNYSLKTPA